MDLFEFAQKRAASGEKSEDGSIPNEAIFSVSELTSDIKSTLEGQFGRERIWVKGELSNFRGRNQTGHMYFSLKDQDAILNCAFFRNANRKLEFDLKEGQEILAGGRISVYPPRGNYQLIVEKVLPGGEGALYLKFEQLKKKLEKEGLFTPERKRSLPAFPHRIGLVTSATGAVVRDIIHVVRNRCPHVTLLLHPVKVQGDGAAEEIAEAIRRLNEEKNELDLLIVGRGGGSIEDLWAFNEEAVARSIAESRLPVVSAVGHQTDFTIADFVADVRAATPSQAAELSVPNVSELRVRADQLMKSIVQELEHSRARSVQRLQSLLRSGPLRDPRLILGSRQQRLELAVERMVNRLTQRRDRQSERTNRTREKLQYFISRFLEPRQAEFKRLAGALGLLDPLAILARGYSVVTNEGGKIVKRQKEVKVKDELLVRLHEGKLLCQVKKIFEKP